MPANGSDQSSGVSERKGFQASVEEGTEHALTMANNTRNDASDMQRLGKAQEFKRNFSYISTLGFISVYSATWELVVIVLTGGIYSGGFAGVFWA